MEKKEIVAAFLKEGYQIDTPTLEYFVVNPVKTSEFIQKIKAIDSKPPIITLDFVKTILKEKEPTIKIIKKFFTGLENEKISITDYCNEFAEIYMRKKKMLMSRVDTAKLLSINKIQKQKDFVLICMVRAKDPIGKSAIVEDLTGSTTVYFEGGTEFEDLLENDTIAVFCESSANGIKVRRTVWPDVPLKREVRKAKRHIYCVFISDFHMDSENFDKKKYEKFVRVVEKIAKKENYGKVYSFILGGVSRRSGDVKKLLEDLPKNTFKIFLRSSKDARVPESEDVLVSEIPITLEIDGIRVLLCQGDSVCKYRNVWKGNATNVMKNILKRRGLRPCVESGQPCIPSKESVIGQIPDIFASGGFHSPETTNYKGVTLITTGDLADDPVFWAVDLKSREINKLDLS